MKKMKMLYSMEHIDHELIEEAEVYTVKRNTWVKWGTAAACLCLIVGAVFAILSINNNGHIQGNMNNISAAGVGENEMRAGNMPEGIDPIIASVAVYPADRNLFDVADATLNEINESEAKATGLGQHFPKKIPEGYHFKIAVIYETTMKDGTKYHLLRLHYTTGDKNNADMSDHADEFSIQLTDFQPNTEKTVYTVDALPNVYVGFNHGVLTHDEIMSVLQSIN